MGWPRRKRKRQRRLPPRRRSERANTVIFMADPKAKPAKKIRGYSSGKSCPKCGSGVRLAEHKDRRSCGKCGYFERK